MARHLLAGAGAAAERAFRRLRSGCCPSSTRRALLYPSFESRSEIAALVAERDRTAAGRAIPMACRSIRAAAEALPAAERKRRIAAGEPIALAARHGCGGGAGRRR